MNVVSGPGPEGPGTRSLFYDDARVDEGLADARDHQPEPEPPAVPDARRNPQVDRLEVRQIADSRASDAPVAPDLAAAPAPRARAPHRHAQRNDRAPERFLRRDDDVGAGLQPGGPAK